MYRRTSRLNFTILNYFDNLSTNASAESINSKIKAFRAKLHGVTDKKISFSDCAIFMHKHRFITMRPNIGGSVVCLYPVYIQEMK